MQHSVEPSHDEGKCDMNDPELQLRIAKMSSEEARAFNNDLKRKN